MKKIAVILSGCGVYDGAEIHETCAALLALHREGAEVVACAPSGPQLHVFDHVRKQPADGPSRDILTESARLVRGDIRPLTAVSPRDIDGVLMPGGFGAAKNLCTFATEGAACRVHPEVEAFLRDAYVLRKPIAAMCIAPVVLARLFGHERQAVRDHRQRRVDRGAGRGDGRAPCGLWTHRHRRRRGRAAGDDASLHVGRRHRPGVRQRGGRGKETPDVVRVKPAHNILWHAPLRGFPVARPRHCC